MRPAPWVTTPSRRRPRATSCRTALPTALRSSACTGSGRAFWPATCPRAIPSPGAPDKQRRTKRGQHRSSPGLLGLHRASTDHVGEIAATLWNSHVYILFLPDDAARGLIAVMIFCALARSSSRALEGRRLKMMSLQPSRGCSRYETGVPSSG